MPMEEAMKVSLQTEKQRQATPVLLQGLSEHRQGGCGLFKAATISTVA